MNLKPKTWGASRPDRITYTKPPERISTGTMREQMPKDVPHRSVPWDIRGMR